MDTVVAAEFHPLERNQIVTCGKGHISFWTLDAGGTLYKRNGIFETTRDRPKYVTCLAFTQNGEVLSGDSNGSVIIWGRGEFLCIFECITLIIDTCYYFVRLVYSIYSLIQLYILGFITY